ncbi:MAG: DapH/DapD/GlmU-related protein [Colwellia sp.]
MRSFFSLYTSVQIMSLLFCVLWGKVFVSRNVRIIRFPYLILGKDKVRFGRGFSAGRRLRLECLSVEGRITIGENVKVNDDVHIGCIDRISIGNNVLVGSKVLITDHQHGKYNGGEQDSPLSSPDDRPLVSAPVVIEDNVWIGELVSIMPGVTIGYGSVVGANSVVTKNIPPKTIAVGSPCKVIKKYNDISKKWELYS